MSEKEYPFLRRILSSSTEVLLVLSLLLFFIFIILGFFHRVNRLSGPAMFLPVETDAFVSLDLKKYPEENSLLSDFYGSQIKDLNWFADDLSLAFIDGEILKFVETKSKSQARKFMESLRAEGESFLDEKAYLCYSFTQPDCFTFKGKFLVLGSKTALSKLNSGLESETTYQNVRNRLPYNADLFLYVNSSKTRKQLLSAFGDLGMFEPGYLESIFKIFPAYGSSIKFKNGKWTAESFIAIDKSKLSTKKFFRPKQKFKGDLLEILTRDYEFIVSGTEFTSLYSEILENLTGLNSASALILQAEMNQAWKKLFGSADFANFAQIFDSEYIFAQSQNKDFIFSLKFKEEDKGKIMDLKDFFVDTSRFQIAKAHGGLTESAYLKNSFAEWRDREGSSYLIFGLNEENAMFLSILEDKIVLSNRQDILFEAVDTLAFKVDKSLKSDFSQIEQGADIFVNVDMTNLPDSHIMNVLLPQSEKWTNAIKIFDDGLYVRTQNEKSN